MLRLYKRTFLIENDLFFESGLYHEDNLFTPLACYYAKKIRVIPDVFYVYRIRGGSISQTANLKRITDIILVANKLSEFFIPKKDIDKTVVYREIAGEYFSVFMSPKAEVLEGDFTEVNRLINWESYKAVSIYPRHKRIYKLIKAHPVFFKIYLKIEEFIKR